MTPTQFLEACLAAPNKAAQQTLLTAHPAQITLDFVQALKTQVDQHKYTNPNQAEQLAGLAQQAAALSQEPSLIALAAWAQGNALTTFSKYKQAVQAYQQAEEIYHTLPDSAWPLAALYTNLSLCLLYLSQFEAALNYSQAARQAFIDLGEAESVPMRAVEMNLGVIYRHLEQYGLALETIAHGRAIALALGEEFQVTRFDINRAKVLEKMDRFQEATEILQAITADFSAEEMRPDVSRAMMNLGYLLMRQGHYRQAIRQLQQARASFTLQESPVEVASSNFFLAEAYLALNLYPEAETLADSARTVFSAEAIHRYQALALSLQASAQLGQGNLSEASQMWAQARTALADTHPLEATMLDLKRCSLFVRQGRLSEAVALAEAIVAQMTAHRWPVRLAVAQRNLAELYLRQNQLEPAETLFQQVLHPPQGEPVPRLRWSAAYGLGRVAFQRGKLAQAEEHFETALHHLEAIHHRLGWDEFQAGFLDDKLEVYHAAMQVALAQTKPKRAWAYAERAKATALRDALARNWEMSGPEVNEALTRWRQLRAEWHWLTSAGGSGLPSEAADFEEAQAPPSDEAEAIRQAKIEALEHQLSELWREIQLAHPHYAPLRPNRQPDLDAIQRALPRDSAVVQYHFSAELLTAFIIKADSLEAVALPGDLLTVQNLVSDWRFELETVKSGSLAANLQEQMLAASDYYLQALYEILLAPLAGQVVAVKSLFIVPDGVLHNLPFATLHTGHTYLGEEKRLFTLPSASFIAPTANKGQPKRALVMAHTHQETLPGTLNEARRVSQLFSQNDCFVENEATSERLRQFCGQAEVLHLAMHGIFQADKPLYSCLYLADTRLTVYDVYTLDLSQAQLVTLSACETGVGDARGGDVLGLSQSFLAAGAQTLLLSLWAVDDEATTVLMTTFYEQWLAGQSKAAALQTAQAVVRTAYPHPFYWAGFVLLGQG